MTRPYADREFPPKHLASLPVDQVAQRPWLLLVSPEILVSPFANRKGGPTEDEMRAIKVMQQRLAKTPIGVWIGPDGRLTPERIEPSVLNAKTRSLTSVRLPPLK